MSFLRSPPSPHTSARAPAEDRRPPPSAPDRAVRRAETPSPGRGAGPLVQMAPFGPERAVQQFGRVRAHVLAASPDQQGEQRERGRIYWRPGYTQPSSPPVRPARITLLRPAPSGHGEDGQELPDSPSASRLSRGTPPLPSPSALELLCGENPSDDRSCPHARSLADLMPTPDRPPGAPPGPAHHSPPPSSPLLHPRLPQAGPAGWGQPGSPLRPAVSCNGSAARDEAHSGIRCPKPGKAAAAPRGTHAMLLPGAGNPV